MKFIAGGRTFPHLWPHESIKRKRKYIIKKDDQVYASYLLSTQLLTSEDSTELPPGTNINTAPPIFQRKSIIKKFQPKKNGKS